MNVSIAREMVEQEDVAGIDLTLFIVHLDPHTKDLAHLVEGPRAPVIGLLVEVEVVVHVRSSRSQQPLADEKMDRRR